jgi:hypothetical protein
MPEREDEFEEPTRRRPRPRDEEDEYADRPRRRRVPRDEDDDYDDRPRRRRPDYDEDDDFDDRPRRRRRRREPAPPGALVTGVGIVNLGIALLFLGLLAYTLFRGTQVLNFIGFAMEDAARQQVPQDPRLAQKMQQVQGMMTGMVAGFLLFLSGCFFLFVIVPLFVAGVGVLLRRQWGRVLTIIVGIVTSLFALSAMERIIEGHSEAVWGALVLAAYSVFVLTIMFIPQYADEFA